MQPVDQGANGRILVIFQQGGVVEGAQQFAAAHEFLAEELVVDVEPERLGGGIQIRPVDEQRKPFVFVEHEYNLPNLPPRIQYGLSEDPIRGR